MQRRLSLPICIVTLLLLPFLVSCGSGTSSVSENPNARRFGPFEFELTTPKTTFASGESIPVTFAVRNVSSKTVNVGFAGCITLHRIILGAQDITPAPICSGDNQTSSLAPNEVKTYTDDLRSEVKPGQDTITVWYHASSIDGVMMTDAEAEQNLFATPIQITVAP
jgi:hypothetical protein